MNSNLIEVYMKKMIFGLCCITLFTVASCSMSKSGVSNNKPHTMVLQKGKVVVSNEEGTKTYSRRGQQITIFDQDRIKTGDDTRILVKETKTGDEIEVYSSSQVKIIKLEKKAGKIKLEKGKARFLVSRTKGARRSIRINTANALIGVKGTEFVVNSIKQGTSLLTLKGAVSLANLTAPDDQVTVTSNQVSRVQIARLPATPVTVTKETISRILKSDQPDTFKGVKFGPVIKGKSSSFSYLNVNPKQLSNQLFWAKLEPTTKFDLHWTDNQNRAISGWNVIKNVSNGYIHKNLVAGKPYYYSVSYLNDANRRTYYVVTAGIPLP